MDASDKTVTLADVADLVERLREQFIATGGPHEHRMLRERDESATALESLSVEVSRCHARLEIDHAFINGERVEVPFGDRAAFPDGIMCRDETIRLQDARIDTLSAELAEVQRLRAELKREVIGINNSYFEERRQLIAERTAHAVTRQKLKDAEKTASHWLNESRHNLKAGQDALDCAEAAEGQYDEALKALEVTRALVCEAAMTGFNCLEGDWAERLFTNNGNISAVLASRRVREGGKADA